MFSLLLNLNQFWFLCFSVVVVATVCRPQDLTAAVVAAFVHQVVLESPTEEQRRSILVSLSRDLHLGRDVHLERLSKLTAVRHQNQNQNQTQTRTDQFFFLFIGDSMFLRSDSSHHLLTSLRCAE